MLPDRTGASAVWVAQRVDDSHVGVVANSFSVREVGLDDTHAFLYSSTMLPDALATKRWRHGAPFDFTRIYAGAEPGHKYASGRRMWRAFNLLAPAAAASLPTQYSEYVTSAPYPATCMCSSSNTCPSPASCVGMTLTRCLNSFPLRLAPIVPAANVSAKAFKRVMRDFYEGTAFDLTSGLAAGAFGSPARWSVPASTRGNWERPISLMRTIVSYVAVCREAMPAVVGGVLWFAFYAAHTAVYVPFPVGILVSDAPLPAGFTSNTASRVDRNVSAHQASRFVFNAAQLDFKKSMPVVRATQAAWEAHGERVIDESATAYIAGSIGVRDVAEACYVHALAAISAWWDLADELQLIVAYPHETYPGWWLDAVNYSSGPPSSPPVPPIRVDQALELEPSVHVSSIR